ncbi:alpha/beta hydrolase [Sphingorhabdus lutea]|uniref:Alpha/beta hydrolase n=1 Tax=Sphingorhabdus lutea TaxID=1913578 RepID=A0A1L3J973_9SPHN|nr:alpha/beta fold hydrolase [Sphingorhabdus lutea]APG61665.1 alpha/beta hydrolase [Sphingorhabdus lutea]
MHISRHYISIEGRRVHYAKCGSGPHLLMVHQSPRSSTEYHALMQKWGQYFTCIAPDLPGFGHSDPLSHPAPEIEDFADAMVEFAHAVGIKKILGYGFHSGGIILVTALKRHMEKFAGLAIGGYAIWNDEERVKIGPPYIPQNPPQPYGQHLVWLWNRILEQSWYFPWFEPSDENRMPVAHDDVSKISLIIEDMLNSGDAYRLGYGAVLRAGRDIPPPETNSPPVQITAYNGDPLQSHLERLGNMPQSWSAFGVDTPDDHYDASLKFLLSISYQENGPLGEDENAGFIHIITEDFDGLIHWQGNKNSGEIYIHTAGEEIDISAKPNAIHIDMPGHGLSDMWRGDAPINWDIWQKLIDKVAAYFNAKEINHAPLPIGDAQMLYPDLSPDRFGHYLTKAWAIVRAEQIFKPWYLADASHTKKIDTNALHPQALAKKHRARIRAISAKQMHIAAQQRGKA